MILLDTDHLSVLKYSQTGAGQRLASRMQGSGESAFSTTIVSVEEQLRGWLAQIHRTRELRRQVLYYDDLASLLDFYRRLTIVPFNLAAADSFAALEKLRPRIGTMDLKIASIALVQDALLLSANLRDFRRVSGLKVENWLD